MSTTGKNRLIFTIIALVAIAVLMFVPVMSYFGGLFPGDLNIDFFKSTEYSFSNMGEVLGAPIDYYQIVVLLFFTVLCLYHLISALTGRKGAFLTSSIICTILWFAPLVLFLTADDRLEYLFDPDRGAYSIGMYALLLIFIVSIIVAAVSKSKKAEQPAFNPYGAPGYVPPYGGPQQPYGQPYGQPAQPYQAPYQPPVQQPVEQPVVPPVQQPEEPVVPPVQQPAEPVVQPEEQFKAPEAVEEAAEQAAEAAKFCPTCGAPIEESGPFCGNCGAKL